ncbi:MAG TPA: HIT domain-containing protein [Gaiellaceae bacterium]|nr:HIT domain-containing protein [Gaiellaceae bacterium]
MAEQCTFCAIGAGGDGLRTGRDDVVLRNEATTAFVAAEWWPGNEGHVLVIPNRHARDIYEIAEADLAAVYATAKRLATAIRRSYGCEGTSMRQHNEPAGGQDVFHFHVHVFPRWADDRLYERTDEARGTTAEERAPYVTRLRDALGPARA